MIIPFAFIVFCGGVLAFFALPDNDVALRVLTFSTAFSIALCALALVFVALSQKLGNYQRGRRTNRLSTSFDDDYGTGDVTSSARSDWATSGVNPSDPALSWQYRQNDARLGRFN